MDWIEHIIQDSLPSIHACIPKVSANRKTLEEKIRLKGPGILELTTTKSPVTILQKLEKSVTKSSQKAGKKFEMEVDALFNKL